MPEDLAPILWTFYNECPMPEDVSDLLLPNEIAICAYKTIRDSAIFTNKRLIVRDSQGLTGKKVEIYSLPYTSIVMYSTENAGKLLDFNSEVELWTKAGHIKIKLNAKADIRKLDRILASALLGEEIII
ncbi:hypothetical protein ING2D1G_0676 [Peptoniphilus sp. ING2-D1G]|nr:hypothetical protein ING2D1G_0676 [Peptoniphilus sp. ING2-D1G]